MSGTYHIFLFLPPSLSIPGGAHWRSLPRADKHVCNVSVGWPYMAGWGRTFPLIEEISRLQTAGTGAEGVVSAKIV